ncbi:hypothetical protein ACVGVM_13570 [Pseudonocardia bannensis]|uniref:Uncharacterized protein n=1 Tax=Pseudonocardia bannensis TaxID=630973 RepID=A0A848DD87_9PSEU|nr:hypothetical protein [Pseudonocardia bannensis]NMH90545.1 hypothetical protein [Pseudonocardia bannensis]
MSTTETNRSQGHTAAAERRNGSSGPTYGSAEEATNGLPPPASEVDADIDLPRLLELTRLTPVQALAIGLDVLSTVEARHRAGAAPVGFDLGSAHVGIDGRTRLDGPLAESGPTPRPRRSALADTGSLLAALARAARQSRRVDERAQSTIAALDRAAATAAAPDGQITSVTALLRQADATAGGAAAATAELAGLVAAALGRPPAARVAVPPRPAHRRPAETRRAPARGGLRGVGSAVARRTWKWALSLAVLAAVIMLEFALLGEHITRDVAVLMNAGRAESSEAPTLPPAPSVPAPAPAAAGAVSGMDLRPLGPCSPGAPCEVRLLVRLQPQADPQTVDWAFRVVDRCTGAAANTPGRAVEVLPDGADVSVVDAVSLPPGRALAVFAVTDRPGTAASPPLLVPAPGYCEADPPPEPR